jgi:hypothetical protein
MMRRPYGRRCTGLQPHHPLVSQFPMGVVRDLPGMAVRVSEVAGVSALEDHLCLFE